MKDISKVSLLTVRIKTDEEREAIRVAMKECGCGTAAGALLRACAGFARLISMTRRQQKEIDRLRKENETLRRCVGAVQTACREIEAIKAEEADTGHTYRV